MRWLILALPVVLLSTGAALSVSLFVVSESALSERSQESAGRAQYADEDQGGQVEPPRGSPPEPPRSSSPASVDAPDYSQWIAREALAREREAVEAGAADYKEEQRRKASGSRKVNRLRLSRGNQPKERICMKGSCERPVAERDGASVLCREHAEVSRATAVQERRRAWVLTCERAVRAAIDAGDERLERRWSKLLLAAEVSFAEAEATLHVAEIRASQPSATRRIPKRATGRP